MFLSLWIFSIIFNTSEDYKERNEDKISCPPCVSEKEIITQTIKEYVCENGKVVSNSEDCIETDSQGWYVVKEFSGTSGRSTDLFRINENRWRYTLKCFGSPDPMYNLEVNRLTNDESSLVSFEIMQKCDEENSPSYVYESPGEFYFVITPASINSWTIKVEAKK